jgi:hypothetical protein
VRVLGGLVAAVMSGLVLAGCAGAGSGSVVRSPSGDVLIAPESDGGDAALVSGTVQMVDGCLGIGDSVALWPHGTRVTRDDPLTIDVPGTGPVEVGSAVRGSGGFLKPGTHGGEPPLPASCASAPVVVFRSL